MNTREKFVKKFGEDDALAIESAAEEHLGASIHGDDNRGSDPFKYVLLAAIGYDCVTTFREYHGITAEAEDLRSWCVEHADLASHDGDTPDYLSLVAGVYSDWMQMDTEECGR